MSERRRRFPRRKLKWHRLDEGDARELHGIDVIAEAIDPAKLSTAQFVQLVETLDMLTSTGTGIELASMRTDTFVRFISRTSRDQLDALMAHEHLRGVVFEELFERMAAHVHPSRATALRAVIHWRFTGGADEDGFDRYQTILADGVCRSTDYPTDDPRVTLTLSPVDLLRVVSGQVGLPMLFLSGKVKVKGDIAFAATLINYFDLPKP